MSASEFFLDASPSPSVVTLATENLAVFLALAGLVTVSIVVGGDGDVGICKESELSDLDMFAL